MPNKPSKFSHLLNADLFQRELRYQAIAHIARRMISQGILNDDEYDQIRTIFVEKYRPVFSDLFSDLTLISNTKPNSGGDETHD